MEVVAPMLGLCGMIVCVKKGTPDKEILDFCNRVNPSGTANGWGKVVRTEKDSFFINEEGFPNDLPLTCADNSQNEHLVVLC